MSAAESHVLKGKIESKVGGVFGFSSSVCQTTVLFEKNQYYLGETIRVKITCDNSPCNKPVTGFKVKLKRKIDVQGMDGNLEYVTQKGQFHFSQYVA